MTYVIFLRFSFPQTSFDVLRLADKIYLHFATVYNVYDLSQVLFYLIFEESLCLWCILSTYFSTLSNRATIPKHLPLCLLLLLLSINLHHTVEQATHNCLETSVLFSSSVVTLECSTDSDTDRSSLLYTNPYFLWTITLITNGCSKLRMLIHPFNNLSIDLNMTKRKSCFTNNYDLTILVLKFRRILQCSLQV